MADNETDDDSFMKQFMERAKRRQALLAQVESSVAPSIVASHNDVTYPPLSPLPEEQADDDQADALSIDQIIEESNIENKEESVSPSDSELNYSSDLSLECETNEVYRAEPVVCQSSPDRSAIQPQYTHRASPRKQIPQATALPFQSQFYNTEQPAAAIPLQERQPEQQSSSSQSLPSLTSTEQALKDLQLKVGRAEQTRTQLKKVVEISKYGSKEHVEAARLLKIAELEHLICTDHMAKYKQGIRKRTESLGSIRISSIRLKISSRLRDELADDGVSHYFFCVASCGAEVKATEILNTNDIRRQDSKAHLQFKDKISFIDLPPDFGVKIEVFELVTSQQLPKILSMLTPSKKKSRITPETNFKRVGSLKLTLADRDVCYKNFTQWSEHEESKYIERECKFMMELKPEQLPCKAGMLHVRCLDREGRPDWTRFWVDLSSGQVKFWKSKQDALDGKKPNQILEFSDLCSENVQKLTPNDDLYRQNSFVLYSYQQVAGGEKDTLFQRVMKDDNKFKLVKHQMAADSKEDRDSWCVILDRSMHCFREWHGKTKIFPIESVKEIFSS